MKILLHTWTAGPTFSDRNGPYLFIFVRDFLGTVFIYARKIIPELARFARQPLGGF